MEMIQTQGKTNLFSKKLDGRFWLFSALFAILVIGGLYLLCDVFMVAEMFTKNQTPAGHFFAIFGIYLAALIAFFVCAVKLEKYKFNRNLLITFGVAFLLLVIGMLHFKNDRCFDANVDFTTRTSVLFHVEQLTLLKIKAVAKYFIVLSLTYTFYHALPKVINSLDFIKLIGLVALPVIFILVIVSIFVDGGTMVEIIKRLMNGTDLENLQVKCLFESKNTFGFIILVGILFSLLLKITTGKKLFYIFTGVFTLALICTLSKLAIFFDAVILIGYAIYKLVVALKADFKKNKPYLILTCVLVGALVLGAIALEIVTHNISGYLINFVKSPDSTLGTRKVIWQNAVDIITQVNLPSGLGYGIYSRLLYLFNTTNTVTPGIVTEYSHNAYLDMIGNGGIIIFLLFAALILKLVYDLIRGCRVNKELFIFECLLLTMSLIYMMFETSSILFSTSLDGMLLGGIVILPIKEMKKVA